VGVKPIASYSFCGYDIIGDELGIMSGLFGKIEEFDREREDWPQYVERLQMLFFRGE